MAIKIRRPALQSSPAFLFGLALFVGGSALISWKMSPPDRSSKRNSSQLENSINNARASKRDLSDRLEPAMIDVDARLLALYQRYPNLRPSLIEGHHQSLASYMELITPAEAERIDVAAKPLREMIENKADWDPELAWQFLINEHDLIAKLIHLGPIPDTDYEKFTNKQAMAVNELLCVGFACQLKLGRQEAAAVIHRALRANNQHLANGSLFAQPVAILSNLSLTATSQHLIADKPELIEQLTIESQLQPKLSAQMVNETSAGLTMAYSMMKKSADGTVGHFYPDGIMTIDETEKYFAGVRSEIIDGLEKLESTQDDMVRPDQLAEITEQVVNRYPDDERTQALISHATNSLDIYTHYWQAIEEQKYQLTAMQIAVATARGENFTGELPVNTMTGEVAIWDKENNQLIYHNGETKRTIKIPTP